MYFFQHAMHTYKSKIPEANERYQKQIKKTEENYITNSYNEMLISRCSQLVSHVNLRKEFEISNLTNLLL